MEDWLRQGDGSYWLTDEGGHVPVFCPKCGAAMTIKFVTDDDNYGLFVYICENGHYFGVVNMDEEL